MYTIIKKELKELWFVVPIAMFIGALFCWLNLHDPSYEESFRTYLVNAGLLCGLSYATAIALWQHRNSLGKSARSWEFSQGCERWEWFVGKSLVAIVLYLGAVVPGYAYFYWWLCQHYPASGPIDPRSMHVIAFPLLLSFIAYPSTVWVLYRPARWFGSRIFPLSFVGFVLVVRLLGIHEDQAYSRFAVVFVSLQILAVLVAWLGAFYSYSTASNRPTRWNKPRHGANPGLHRVLQWSAFVGLAISTGFTWLIFIFLGAVMVESSLPRTPPTAEPRFVYAIESDGHLQRFIESVETNIYGNGKYDIESTGVEVEKLSLSPISQAGSEQAASQPAVVVGRRPLIDSEWGQRKKAGQSERLSKVAPPRMRSMFEYFTRQTVLTQNGQWYLHSDGALYGYSVKGRELSEDGRLRSIIPFPLQLTSSENLSLYPVGLPDWDRAKLTRFGYCFSEEGIYEVDEQTKRVEALYQDPIEALGVLKPTDERPMTLVVLDSHRVVLFDLLGSVQELGEFGKSSASHSSHEPRLSLTNKRTISLPNEWKETGERQPHYFSILTVQVGEDGSLFLAEIGSYRGINSGIRWVELTEKNQDGAVSLLSQAKNVYEYLAPRSPATPFKLDLVQGAFVALVPPLITSSLVLSYGDFSAPKTVIVGLLVLILLQIVTALVATVWAANRRMLHRKHRLVWLVLTIPFGWLVPICILAVHYRIAKVHCVDCRKACRADESICPHCGGGHLVSKGQVMLPDGFKVIELGV